ncbi:uncharacterized protein, partial [Venturia canescens]|uniref:uncharacterized protein n=1 Tax=Venturia canescens TaxID=32260 RepID=UPI001C9C25AE
LTALRCLFRFLIRITHHTDFLQDQPSDIEEESYQPSDIEEGSYFNKFREYLARYQEFHGIPRTEYTFPALIKVMGQATGRSLLALLYVVLNVTPIILILLHILRFILDKTISIQNTNDSRQMLVKYAILGVQLLCIYVFLVFIFGCIVIPIVHMTIGVIVKIILYT